MKQHLYSEFQQRLNEMVPTTKIILDHRGQPLEREDGMTVAEMKNRISQMESNCKENSNPIIEFVLESSTTNTRDKQDFMASVMAQINNRKLASIPKKCDFSDLTK